MFSWYVGFLSYDSALASLKKSLLTVVIPKNNRDLAYNTIYEMPVSNASKKL